MKSSRLIVAVLLFTIALMCFISAPVFSGDDPWDVDGGSGGGDGSDIIVPPPPSDSLLFEGTHSVGGGNDLGWLSGLTYHLSYEFINYFFGDDETSEVRNQVAVDESSGNVTAQ